MLRVALALVALALLLGGVAARAGGLPMAVPLLIWGTVLLLAVIFERWRYRPRISQTGGWQPTDERFIDPQTGQALQVLYNPHSGQRRYIPVTPAADIDPDPDPHVPLDPHSQSR